MNQQLQGKYDSEFCGSLPIHLINVIQPYGVLLVVEKHSLLIRQASENVNTITGKPAYETVDTRITDYLETNYLLLASSNVPTIWEIRGQKYLVTVHTTNEYYLLEVNLHSAETLVNSQFIDFFQEIKPAITAIENCKTVMQAAEIAAGELKRVSGFDKVMVYKFDEEWNGHVLSEAREPEMESYLHFTFPASDIPKQARDLYLRNSYRFIPDRSYTPVPLYPVINPITSTFLDMSPANLKGVSVVHLEYLKNMKVTASMSTRILKDGQLWGLIACHNQTAMTMDLKMCSMFEFLSGVISARITTLEDKEEFEFNTGLKSGLTSILEETHASGNVIDTLFNKDENLLKLFNSEGAIIMHDGKVKKLGKVPSTTQVEDLLMWLNTRDLGNVFHTESLSSIYGAAADFRELGSGILVIPIDQQKDEYLILFRAEAAQVINWGGNPEERISFEQDMKTYHPRFSFQLWQENVNGTSLLWKKEEAEIAKSIHNLLEQYLA